MEPEVVDIKIETNLKQVQQEMRDTAKVSDLMAQSFKQSTKVNYSQSDLQTIEKYKDTLEDMMTFAKTNKVDVSKMVDDVKLTALKDGSATIERMSEGFKESAENAENLGKNLNISFKGGIKMLTKFTLGLIGIRSVWSILTRASHEYLSENKEINEQLKLSFSIIANVIGPAIKGLVSIIEYAAIIIAKMVQTLTGVNIIAKVTTNAMKNLGKEAKKTQNALASFDTISNLAQNQDAMESYAAMLEAFNDFESKVGEIEKFWKDWGNWVTAGVAALGLLWGAKTLSGLAKLIGVASTTTTAGTGLLGVSSLLAGLATFTALTITIWLVIKYYERIKELEAFLNKWTPEEINERVNALNDVEDVTEYIAENTEDIKNNAAITGENYNFWNEMVGIISGKNKDVLKSAKDIVEATGKINEKVENIMPLINHRPSHYS